MKMKRVGERARMPVLLRGRTLGLLAGRSPDSQLGRRSSPSPTVVEWMEERLAAYSGGTAPASHRLPCWAHVGTRELLCGLDQIVRRLVPRSERRSKRLRGGERAGAVREV